MLKIEGRTFMNIQEAVQWLLENNALPFQCTANYQANTEIGLGTIVNPSPAKVRIGSLIFFADSKVSTVVGITEAGFICSDKYNNLVDDIAYVTNVAINGSGHLITTLSGGQTIDAGIVKQVSSLSIDASQHLIVSYNDGTTSDLGAIFNGNVNIAGNFTANSIIENMFGYYFHKKTSDQAWTSTYVGAVKNGNKLTLVVFGSITTGASQTNIYGDLGYFEIPQAVADQLYPFTLGSDNDVLDNKRCVLFDTSEQPTQTGVDGLAEMRKYGGNGVMLRFYAPTVLSSKTYVFRAEVTFLLSPNLAS